jgi:hypothetical protein
MMSELERGRINTIQDRLVCYDLGIYLTPNDCCHEDGCAYAAQCMVIRPSRVDTVLA